MIEEFPTYQNMNLYPSSESSLSFEFRNLRVERLKSYVTLFCVYHHETLLKILQYNIEILLKSLFLSR